MRNFFSHKIRDKSFKTVSNKAHEVSEEVDTVHVRVVTIYRQ